MNTWGGLLGQAGPTIEVGLHEVAGSASLTLVTFPALVMLSVLGVRFSYYAYRNRTTTALARQTPVWSHLAYAGLFAATYGVLGAIEIVTSVRAPYKHGVMLAVVLLLALAIRRIHALATNAGAAGSTDRATRAVFAVLVAAHVAGTLLVASSRLLATLEGLVALAVLAYGATFYRDQTSQSRLQGTMIDSLLRHLLPVMTFAALVPITSMAYGLGLVGRNVVPHVQVVFVIVTASTLMTATIKLRQNLASL